MQPADPLIAALRNWMEVSMRRSLQESVLYTKKSGLSMPQIAALFQVQRGIGGVSDLGEELGVTSAAASQMLDRLVQLGLILRTEDPQDRRVKRMVLTDKGRKVLQGVIQVRQRWLDDLVRTLHEGEKEQITAVLNSLVDKAKQLDAVSELNR